MTRVLVYRLGSIGDTVIALPAFHLIRQHFPRDHITVLTNCSAHEKAAPLASVLPQCLYDEILEYPLTTRGLKELGALRARIMEQKFELMISLAAPRGFWKSIRDNVFFYSCNIPDIRGIPLRRSDLSCAPEPGSDLYRSETRRLLDRLGWLGTVNPDEDRWWDLQLSQEERDVADSLLNSLGVSKPILAFSIGAKVDTKDWSQQNWMSLISRLSSRSAGYSLISIGSKDEWSRSQELLDIWHGEKANLCGQASPRVSACVLQRANLYIGHDSGPLHLAAAVGTPSVAVYSARDPPGQWFPRGRNNRVFYNRTPCFGCRLERCIEFEKKCILSIPVGQVFDAIDKRLTFQSQAGSERISVPTTQMLQ